MNKAKRWVLVGITGRVKGREFVILSKNIHIGRTPENDIHIPEKSISRHHATINIENMKLQAHDMKSKNGTLVNSKKISKEELNDSDILQIGESSFRIKLEEAPQLNEIEQSTKETDNTENSPILEFLNTTLGKVASFVLPFILMILIPRLFTHPPKADVAQKNVALKQNLAEPEKTAIPSPTITKQDIYQIDTTETEQEANSSSIDTEELYTSANNSIGMNDYLSAIKSLKLILKNTPNDQKALLLLEESQIKLKKLITNYDENASREYEKLNFEKAIIEWQKVLSLTKDFDQDFYNRTLSKISETRQKLVQTN